MTCIEQFWLHLEFSLCYGLTVSCRKQWDALWRSTRYCKKYYQQLIVHVMGAFPFYVSHDKTSLDPIPSSIYAALNTKRKSAVLLHWQQTPYGVCLTVTLLRICYKHHCEYNHKYGKLSLLQSGAVITLSSIVRYCADDYIQWLRQNIIQMLDPQTSVILWILVRKVSAV